MMCNMERERRIGAGFDAAISLLIIGTDSTFIMA